MRSRTLFHEPVTRVGEQCRLSEAAASVDDLRPVRVEDALAFAVASVEHLTADLAPLLLDVRVHPGERQESLGCGVDPPVAVCGEVGQCRIIDDEDGLPALRGSGELGVGPAVDRPEMDDEQAAFVGVLGDTAQEQFRCRASPDEERAQFVAPVLDLRAEGGRPGPAGDLRLGEFEESVVVAVPQLAQGKGLPCLEAEKGQGRNQVDPGLMLARSRVVASLAQRSRASAARSASPSDRDE